MTWQALIRLCRLSRIATIWSGTIAGAFLAGTPNLGAVAAAAFALSLLYCGGSMLDDAYDAPIDLFTRPQRPIPKGQIKRAVAFGMGFAALAAAVLLIGIIAALFTCGDGGPGLGAALVLAGVIVLYCVSGQGDAAAPTFLAFCRGLVYVVSALAVVGRLSSPLAIGAVLLALYALGLACACDRGARSRFWPLWLLLAPFAGTMPLLTGHWDQTCLWFGGLAWVAFWTVRLMQRDFLGAEIGLTAAMPLVDALLISQRGPTAAVWLAATAFPATWLIERAQRRH